MATTPRGRTMASTSAARANRTARWSAAGMRRVASASSTNVDPHAAVTASRPTMAGQAAAERVVTEVTGVSAVLLMNPSNGPGLGGWCP